MLSSNPFCHKLHVPRDKKIVKIARMENKQNVCACNLKSIFAVADRSAARKGSSLSVLVCILAHITVACLGIEYLTFDRD